jgi:hypothetical protein
VAANQKAAVTPASGLAPRQTVHVTGTGFKANESLVVTECADKGTNTGPGDCDLQDMASVSSDGNGGVQVDLTVVKGPFGDNKIVCGAQQCLVSVSQASLSPTEEADVPISFS